MVRLISLTGVVLAMVVACTIQIDMEDGTARIEECPGVEFEIVLIQGQRQPSARATADGETVRFESEGFDDIDFTRPMTIRVFVATIPPGSECPMEVGVEYELENTIPDRIEDDLYEIDLADFTPR